MRKPCNCTPVFLLLVLDVLSESFKHDEAVIHTLRKTQASTGKHTFFKISVGLNQVSSLYCRKQLLQKPRSLICSLQVRLYFKPIRRDNHCSQCSLHRVSNSSCPMDVIYSFYCRLKTRLWLSGQILCVCTFSTFSSQLSINIYI